MATEMLSKEPMKYALIDEESNARLQRSWRYRLGLQRYFDSETLKPCASISLLGICCLLSVMINLSFIYHWSSNQTDQFWTTDKLPPFEDVKFSSQIHPTSKYTGVGPEVDAEWDRFTKSPLIDGTAVVLSISEDEIARSGKRYDGEVPFNTTVALKPEDGGGYMGTIELFHQLHCLNVLRKSVHKDYYEDKDPFFKMKEIKIHTDHCVEMLRQVLMCNGDMQVISFHWVDAWPGPVPDFNTRHSCRDPEAVLQWAKDREAPLSHTVHKPDNAIALPRRP